MLALLLVFPERSPEIHPGLLMAGNQAFKDAYSLLLMAISFIYRHL
jgi:hypothetical protein